MQNQEQTTAVENRGSEPWQDGPDTRAGGGSQRIRGKARVGGQFRFNIIKQELEPNSARSDSEACSRAESDRRKLTAHEETAREGEESERRRSHAQAIKWTKDSGRKKKQREESGWKSKRRSESKTREERERLASDALVMMKQTEKSGKDQKLRREQTT